MWNLVRDGVEFFVTAVIYVNADRNNPIDD